MSDELENQDGEEEIVLDDLNEIDETKKSLQTEIARKKHWREKAQRETDERKKLEIELSKFKQAPKPEVPEDLVAKVNKLELVETKRQFGSQHSLTADETDFVFSTASGLGVDPAQAKDNPFVKAALEAQRAQRRAEQATPHPSSRAVTSDGRTFGELKTDDERRKAFTKIAQG